MACIKVAAVQSGVDPRWTPGEWSNHLRWQLAVARDAGADLTVFPAWIGSYQDSFPSGYPREALGTLLRLLGDLAREAGMHLVPGSLPVRCPDGIRLRSFLIDPEGELLGEQDQIQPPAGFRPGQDLRVFSSKLGCIGIIIGEDAFVPEIGRILALQGADLFCVPQSLPAPYNPWRQIAGTWQAVQANQVPAAEACLVGEFNGVSHAGCSRVLSVVETTTDDSGFLAEAHSTTETEIVTGEIDLTELERARKAFPIFHGFNLRLYRNLVHAYSHEIWKETREPRQSEGQSREPANRDGEAGGGEDAGHE